MDFFKTVGVNFMYNVIIVDDELGTVESLKAYIDDLTVGFNVIACLKKGKEAVDFW